MSTLLFTFVLFTSHLIFLEAKVEAVTAATLSKVEIQIQNEIKEFVAQYLREAGDVDSEGRILESNHLPLEFGHKHHHHKNPIAAVAAASPVLAAAAPVAAVAALPVSNNVEAARVDTATATATTQNPILKNESSSASIPILNPAKDTPNAAAAPAAAAPIAAPAVPAVPTVAPVALPTPTRPTVDPVHHLNQVNKILGNVANGNIVGIVDESLAIRAPIPVRNLVTNILKVVFCNPIDRILRRCAPNQVDAANNSVSGK